MARHSGHQQLLVINKAWKKKGKIGLRKGRPDYKKADMRGARTRTDINQSGHRLHSRISRQGILRYPSRTEGAAYDSQSTSTVSKSSYDSSYPSRTEEAAYDSRSTSMASMSGYDYSEPSKGLEYSSRHHRESPTNISVGGISMNYRQTETIVEVNESAYEHTKPGNQYSSPPRYTERQTIEVEKEIMQALKSRGRPVSQQEFDKLVNERLEQLYRPQQRQYQSKPLSQSQGQKPPSGYIPSTRFLEPGGQRPAPGSVPLTQFPGSGGQNPLAGSLSFTPFPDPGGQNPPQGSVPLAQFPGSEPAATQPDYGGSYGFSATSGGPESNYLMDIDSLNEPSSQSYDPPKREIQISGWSRHNEVTNRKERPGVVELWILE